MDDAQVRRRLASLTWKQRCYDPVCRHRPLKVPGAAQRDLTTAAFLLGERIPLDDRFEVAAGILCPGSETARALH